MNAYAYYSQEISDSERDTFEQALTIYYTGKWRIVDAFAQVERGLIDRYYRRKKAFPDEMAEIDRKARAAALHERDAPPDLRSRSKLREAWYNGGLVSTDKRTGKREASSAKRRGSYVKRQASSVERQT